MTGNDRIFTVIHGPGLFRLIAWQVDAYRNWTKPQTFELTLEPFVIAAEPFSFMTKFKIEFEVALRGESHKHPNYPKDIRFLGRFLINEDFSRSELGYLQQSYREIAERLSEWQWEVILTPGGQSGSVYRLSHSLPAEWVPTPQTKQWDGRL